METIAFYLNPVRNGSALNFSTTSLWKNMNIHTMVVKITIDNRSYQNSNQSYSYHLL